MWRARTAWRVDNNFPLIRAICELNETDPVHAAVFPISFYSYTEPNALNRPRTLHRARCEALDGCCEPDALGRYRSCPPLGRAEDDDELDEEVGRADCAL